LGTLLSIIGTSIAKYRYSGEFPTIVKLKLPTNGHFKILLRKHSVCFFLTLTREVSVRVVLFYLTTLMLANIAQSATLNLSGTITANCVLNSIDSVAYTVPHLDTTTQTVVVAKTNITCNSAPGFKLTASSANNGVLVNTSSPGNNAAYKLKIYGTGTNGSLSLATPQDLVLSGALAAPLVNELRDIEIAADPAAVKWAGTYTDTVTITLTSTP
jgi:hypothetical protein